MGASNRSSSRFHFLHRRQAADRCPRTRTGTSSAKSFATSWGARRGRSLACRRQHKPSHSCKASQVRAGNSACRAVWAQRYSENNLKLAVMSINVTSIAFRIFSIDCQIQGNSDCTELRPVRLLRRGGLSPSVFILRDRDDPKFTAYWVAAESGGEDRTPNFPPTVCRDARRLANMDCVR